jgi:hypothetical protein
MNFMKTKHTLLVTVALLAMFACGAGYGSMRTRRQVDAEIATLNRTAIAGLGDVSLVARIQIDALRWAEGYPINPSSNTLTWAMHIRAGSSGGGRGR